MTTQQILDDKVQLYLVDVKVPGNYRRATDAIITELGGKVPNGVTRGSIPFFPGEKLAPLSSVRRALKRDLKEIGLKGMGTGQIVAFPKDEAAKAEAAISKAETEFAAERSDLESNYDTIFEDFAKLIPSNEAIIRRVARSKAEMLAGCSFSVVPFQIVPGQRANAQKTGVQTTLEGLARQVFVEISAEFETFAKKDPHLKRRVNQRSLNVLRDCITKMRSWAFLDPVIAPTADFITEALSILPKQGWVEGEDYAALDRLIECASDPDDLLNAGCRKAKGCSAQDLLFPAQSPVAQSALPLSPAVVEQSAPVTEPAPAPVEAPLPTPAEPMAAPELMLPPTVDSGSITVPVAQVQPQAEKLTPAIPVIRKPGTTKPGLLF